MVAKAGKEAEVSRELNKVVAAKAAKAAASTEAGKEAEVRVDEAEVSREAAAVAKSKPRGGQKAALSFLFLEPNESRYELPVRATWWQLTKGSPRSSRPVRPA